MKRLACFYIYNFLLNGQTHMKIIFSWYMQTANPTLFVVHFGNNRYTKAFANNDCYNYQINFKFLSRLFLPRVSLNNSSMFLRIFSLIYHASLQNKNRMRIVVYHYTYQNWINHTLTPIFRSLNMKFLSLHICQCYISWLTKM